jgi:SAM-dependent methyltransferase
LKVATVFYYADEGNPRYSHLKPLHVKRCVKSLIECGFDNIIVRDDGSQPWLKLHEVREQGWTNTCTIELHNSPQNIGINQGMRWMADRVLEDDIILHVDPHCTYNPQMMARLFNVFQEDKQMQVMMVPVIPGRVSVGPWAAFRSDYVDNKIGVNVCMACRGGLYKRYASEYLSKLKPEDKSWPMAHFERWLVEQAYPVDKERHRHFLEPDGRLVVFGVHDDELTMWQQFESCYNNGMKAAETDLKGLPPAKAQVIQSIRSRQLPDFFNEVEGKLWLLGAGQAKFRIDEKMRYDDVMYAGEEVDPRQAVEHPYMFTADKYVLGSVFDAGCGNGIFAFNVWSMRPHVHDERKGKAYDHGGEPHSAILGLPHYVGIDICKIAIQHAAKANRETAKICAFYEGDILTQRGEDAYDTVLCLQVLEHMPQADARRAVQRMFDLCRHRVVASVPAVDMHQGDHWKAFYTESELKELFSMFSRVELLQGDQLRWLIVAHKREVPKP